MKIRKLIFIASIFFTASQAFGQQNNFTFHRTLSGINDQWHHLDLDEHILSNSNSNFGDLRVLGLTPRGDTVEASYFISSTQAEIQKVNFPFRIINATLNQGSQYFTITHDNEDIINQIQLSFEEENFDWRIDLEGSQDQNQWFQILKDYRILSINNTSTNYQFTFLNLPDSKFKFYRIKLDNVTNAHLNDIFVSRNIKNADKLVAYQILKTDIIQNKEDNQTAIEVSLKYPLPVSVITLNAEKTFDFYRPMQIAYLADSTLGEKGWVHNYRNILRTTFSSLENNTYPFATTKARKFRITIDNHDNPRVKINNVGLSGFSYSLTIRFVDEAHYALYYGNETIDAPIYDIDHYKKNIPESLNSIPLGKVTKLELPNQDPAGFLFLNQWWLWGIMVFIIGLLAWLTIKMMTKK